MRMLLHLMSILIVVISCAKTPEQSHQQQDLITFTISHDFETNELYAWESYPYAQDIGYDPCITCQPQPAHSGSKYALARIVKPNDALDLSEGFTRQIDLWTTKDTRLKCALFLMSDRKPEKVEVMLGLFDGRLFTHTVRSPEVNRWVELDITTAEFANGGKSLGLGEHVQVVAFKAFYPLVSHLVSYTILMDDFSLNGDRPRQFIAREPQSTCFDKFGISVLGRHFFYGDAISLIVEPEGGKKLSTVECSVVTPDGAVKASGVQFYDDGSHGDSKAGDGVWTNSAIYTIGVSDPRGQWTLDLTGKTGGNDVRWGLRFIMPGKRLTEVNHPRLFFTKEEIAARMSSNEPATAKKILANALRISDRYKDTDIDSINEGVNLFEESLTGGPYSQTDEASGRWRRPLAALGGIIETGAFNYAFTGDEEVGNVARKALLKLCSFKAWNNPWMEAHGCHIYFPVGYMTRQVAIGYDFLYPLMTEEERAFVRAAIMDKAIEPFYRDMVEMNRMPSSLSNHIAVIVAGVGAAATAIYGDDPVNPALEPYLSGIMTKMKTFIDRTYFPEGSYGEPYTYQAMASRDLTETLFAFERNFGVDYTTTTNLKDLWMYPLYAIHSSSRYQDFGDVSLWYGMAQTHCQWLTYRMHNPWTYAYVKPYWEAGNGGYMGYLWYTEGFEPRYRTELPTSKLFSGKGNMIMRSDWKDDGSIVIFKCGPNSNHYHLDQGTFVIMTNGDELLSDAGHSDGYYSNLYYPCYYTQAIGNNVMLVDMNPERQNIADYENGVAALRDYPRIGYSFARDIADGVEGDLTCVYKGALERYTRSLVYLKPGALFLFDRVRGNGGHEYNWLFHAEHTDGKSSITYNKGRVTIARPKATLTMDVLAPAIASNSIRNSDRDESFIALSSEQGLTETAFLAVLMPGVGKGTVPAVSERIEADGWLGAKVNHDGSNDTAMFTVDGAEHTIDNDTFYSEAERFAVSRNKTGQVERFFLRGKSLTVKGAQSRRINSLESVSTAVRYGVGGAAALYVEAQAETAITLTMPQKPVEVLVNGSLSDEWQYDIAAKEMTIKVQKGRSEVRIK